MIERDVKKAVRELLTEYGWVHWMPPANAFGKSGIADINAVRDGMFLAIETKVGKNILTAPQRMFLNNIRAAGGWAFMVNETRVPALREWLRCVSDNRRDSDFQMLTRELSHDPLPPKALR